MKRIIFLLIVSTFTITIYGQVSGTISGTNQKVELTTLDQASIRCHYQFVQKDKAGLLQIDTMTLDIGAQMSEYYDIAKQKQDSLFWVRQKLIPRNVPTNVTVTSEEIVGGTSITSGRPKESARLLKNRQTGEIIIIDVLFDNKYRFTETIRPQAWQIAADTATILGYFCQRATATFRGRSYEAWFSPEIPVNDGPWKFFGLPGLILKVTDTENVFSFVCVGLESLTPPHDITIEQINYINASRSELAKIKTQQSGGIMLTDKGGRVFITLLNAKDDYNPLELE